jgi:hypothetical protein
VPEEKPAGDEGAEGGRRDPAPAGGAGGIDVRCQPAGEEDERHDDQPDDGPDYEAEHQRELIFALAQPFDRAPEDAGPVGG